MSSDAVENACIFPRYASRRPATIASVDAARPNSSTFAARVERPARRTGAAVGVTTRMRSSRLLRRIGVELAIDRGALALTQPEPLGRLREVDDRREELDAVLVVRARAVQHAAA